MKIMLIATAFLVVAWFGPVTRLHAQCDGVNGPYLAYSYTGNACSGYKNPATITVSFTNGNGLIDATIEKYSNGYWQYYDYLILNGGEASFTDNITQATQFRVTSNDCPSIMGTITVNPPAPAQTPQGAYGSGYSCLDGRAYFELAGAPAGTTYDIYFYSEGTYNWIGSTTTTEFYLDLYSASEQYSYYVQTLTNSGCQAPPSQILISHINLTAPVVSGTTTLCKDGSTTLTASGPGYHQWYNASGQYLDITSDQFNTGPLQTSTSFKVKSVYEQCQTAFTTVPITVQNPAAPSITMVPGCAAPVTIRAPGSGFSSYEWYDSFGNQIPGETASTYYASEGQAVKAKGVTSIGCKSDFSTLLTATVLYSTGPVVSQEPGCGPSKPVAVSASGLAAPSWQRFEWYTDAACTELMYSKESEAGSAQTTLLLGTTEKNYWVRIFNIDHNCYSPITPTTVYSGQTLTTNVTGKYCENNQLQLNVQGSGTPAETTYSIYSYNGTDHLLVAALTAGERIITEYVSGDPYYVQASSRGCQSELVSIPVDFYYPLSPPSVISPVENCNDSGQVTISASANNTIAFNLYDNTSLVSSNTTGTFGVPKNEIVSYQVRAIHSICNIETPPATVIINIPDVPPLPDKEIKACKSDDITINSELTSGSVRWYDNNDQLVDTGLSLHVGTLAVGTYVYQAEVTSSLGCISATRGIVTIRVGNICDENRNYIRTFSSQIPISSVDEFESEVLNKEHVTINTQYVDGIGRSIQVVNHGNSPNGRDVVVHKEYDEFGRETLSFLPYPTNAYPYAFKENAKQHQLSFYALPPDNVKADAAPFGKRVFEPSPLNRVIKQGAPGEAWQPDLDPNSLADNTVKKRYGTNVEGEVLLFKYDPASGLVSLDVDPIFKYYGVNQLYANQTFDEHNNEVIEYVDKEGRTICKKVQYKEGDGVKAYAATYYIYDDFGNLVIVLPPEAIKNLGIDQ